MEKKLSLFLSWICATLCIAQTIENPAFDKSDVPAFHITKVVITEDTTYVFCSYYAEAGSWANISKETFLRDSKSHITYPLLRTEGFPISPNTREFPQNEHCDLLFCFPSIAGTEQFDFIESEGNIAFNIYNICLNRKFKTSYSDAELNQITELLFTYDSFGDTEKTILLKDYTKSLYNLERYKASIGNYVEAIRLGTVELKIKEKTFGKEYPDYIETLGNLARYYSAIGNYAEAIQLQMEVAFLLKKSVGVKNNDYATSISELALYHAHIGNYIEAIRFGTEMVKIHKEINGVNHPLYATSLGNLAVFYAYIGNYSEAIKLEKEAMKINKEVLGTENSDYAQSLNNLAGFYAEIGNYAEAVFLGKEAVEIKKNNLGTEHPEYALSLRNLAADYFSLGDYTEALRLDEEVLKIREKTLGTEHSDYARSLHDLSTVYYSIGKYEEALQLLAKATKIRKTVLGTNHPDYAFSLNDLALCYARVGNFAEAIRLGKNALEIRKKVLGTEHPDYASSLNDYAECCFRGGYYTEAERFGIKAVEQRKKILGNNHPSYARSLLNLALYYYYHGNYVKAYDCVTRYIECSRSFVLNTLGELSSHLQTTLWEGGHAYQFVSMLPCLVYKYRIEGSVSELYDSACLFAKGLLLNTGIEMRRLIIESRDSSLIKKFDNLSTNINIYNKLIEKPIKEHFMNIDSLNSEIQKQEMELARESKIYGDYTRNLTITWKEVQRNLADGDIAIEFLDFPIVGTDSTMYVALTLKKGYDSPHMVTLFEDNQLKAISEEGYYTKNDVSDVVWKPLEEELKGIRNIYFAPSGELHRIGIEHLPISKTENISDIYTLHRLSSTRQLAVIPDESEGKNTILYGGINYDEKSSATSIDSVSTERSILRSAFSRANVDSLSLRSSFEYLEGTKREADMIAKDLKQHSVPYIYYSGTEGTEESFKLLDGTKPKAMHIATHGFYFTEAEAVRTRYALSEMELKTEGGKKTGRPMENKPMTRSGLLFSGCNRAFRHEHIPEREEDGILTAQEISTLDLRGLDLVVLSACQTGLGDVISGEGVFGLQRGFKKSGAKTILMSLNKVDDEATRILMVEFYRNLMNGKTKRQSLKDAQKHLRLVENGKYDKPEYWASFIMLDGLD